MGNNEIKDVENKQRVAYIDLFRALGIVFMIMGHIGFGSLFDKWIHVFHMPMFFIVSGYFYKTTPISHVIAKRAKTIITPYLIFGLLACILHYIEIKRIDLYALYLLFWENTAGDGIPLAGALWFLTAMFFADVLYSITDNVIKLGTGKELVVAGISLLGMCAATFLPIRLPFAIDVAMVGVGFIHIGRMLQRRLKGIIELKLIWAIIGIIIFTVLGLLNGYVNLRNGRYGIWPLFWINALGLSFSLWNLCRYLYNYIGRYVFLKKMLQWAESIGRDSVVFLCLNQLVIHYFGDFMWYLMPTEVTPLLFLAIRSLITLIGTLIILCFARRIFIKTKLRICIGR